MYLSLGTYNLLVHCPESQEQQIERYVKSHGAPFEKWHVVDGAIACITASELEIPASEVLSVHLEIEDALEPAAREYRLLTSGISKYGLRYRHESLERIRRFNEVFAAIVSEEGNELARLHDLTIANAALSRYYSNVYSGTSPILETECSFTTHSLLGLGVATTALEQIEAYVGKVIAEHQPIARIRSLRYVEPQVAGSHLWSVHPEDEFYKTDQLFAHGESQDVRDLLQSNASLPTIPLVPYYSGRDGFRATRYSLSAPVDAIAGCNTVQWTLLTLTHEISHTLIDGVFGVLLPKPSDSEALDAVRRRLSDGSYRSLFEQAQTLLVMGLCRVAKSDDRVEDLALAIQQAHAEVNELLTHIIDFFYFYREEVQLYIRSVWSSWAVIPNIEHRIPEYLCRTLSALYIKHVGRADGPEITLSILVRELQQLRESSIADTRTAAFIEEALGLLEDEATWVTAIQRRELLVLFAKAFLGSDIIRRSLSAEPTVVSDSSRSGDVYGFSNLEFRDEPIANPLRFIEHYSSTEQKPHLYRSVWLLQQLAFSHV